VPRQPQKIDVKTLQQRLAEHGINVSVRTIQRNLIDLSEMFPLTTDEHSKPYGWSIAEGAPQMPFVNLVNQIRNGANTEIKLKCAGSLLSLLTNSPLHPQQFLEHSHSHFTLTATVAISNDLVAW